MRTKLAALALLILPSLPAQAATAVVFAGSEDVSFTCILGTCSTITNTDTFRPAWSRSSYATTANTDVFETTSFKTALSDLWLHQQEYFFSTASTNNLKFVTFVDNLGNDSLVIRGDGTATSLKVSTVTGGVYTDIDSCPPGVFQDNLQQTDIHVVYAVSGSVNFYLNSVLVCTVTGNTTNGDGATTINNIKFSGLVGAQGHDRSEIIVADGDTRQMNLRTYVPNGSGASVAWSGANPCTNILNNNPFNDGTYVFTDTAELVEECVIDATLASGAYTLNSVVMATRGLVGATGPQHFEFVTRVGGTDYFSPDYAPTGTLGDIGPYIQSVNPATSAAWGTTDPAAVGFNIGLKSKP